MMRMPKIVRFNTLENAFMPNIRAPSDLSGDSIHSSHKPSVASPNRFTASASPPNSVIRPKSKSKVKSKSTTVKPTTKLTAKPKLSKSSKGVVKKVSTKDQRRPMKGLISFTVSNLKGPVSLKAKVITPKVGEGKVKSKAKSKSMAIAAKSNSKKNTRTTIATTTTTKSTTSRPKSSSVKAKSKKRKKSRQSKKSQSALQA